MKALIVDCDDESRSLLELLMRRAGAEVLACARGEPGVELAGAMQPDFVLLDLDLPGEDATAIARRVRAACGGTVYIVGVTGFADARDDGDHAFDERWLEPIDARRLRALLGEPNDG